MTSMQYATAPVALPPIKHLLNLSHPLAANIEPKRTRQDCSQSDLKPACNGGSIPPLQGMDPPRRDYTYRRASGKQSSSSAPWSNSFTRPDAAPVTNAQCILSPLASSRGCNSNSRPSSIDLNPTRSAFIAAGRPPPSPPNSALSRSHLPTPPPPEQPHLPPYPQNCLPLIERERPRPTNLSFTTAGNPILKRRRGRPPARLLDGSCLLEGGWTFLSPTVWSVGHPVHDPPTRSSSSSSSSPPQTPGSHATLGKNTAGIQRHPERQITGPVEIQSYIGTDLHSMQIPMRKRGRKPKRTIQGHSCFVWKDIPIIRSPLATAKARATAAANRQARRIQKAPPTTYVAPEPAETSHSP